MSDVTINVPIHIANAIISFIKSLTEIEVNMATLKPPIQTAEFGLIGGVYVPAGIIIAYINAMHRQQERPFKVIIQENCYGSNYKHTIITGTCDANDKLNANVPNPRELLDNKYINLCYEWAIEALETFIRDTKNCIESYKKSIEDHRRYIQERNGLLGTKRRFSDKVWTEEDIAKYNKSDNEHIQEFIQIIEMDESRIANAKSKLEVLKQ